MATGRIPTTANSPLTAKGDLFTFSTGSAKLAVGNNGETLVADSSTSTGLRYAENYAAGKNKIINGDFGINQRSFTSTTSTGTFGFDRWATAFVDGTSTYSAETFTPGAAPVAGYEGTNYARLVTTGQTLSTAQTLLRTRLEDVRIFAGQTVTVSFWAQSGSGTPSVAVELAQVFGTGGSPSASVTGIIAATPKQAISTTFNRYSYTISVPSISGKTLGTTASTSYLQLSLWVSAGSNFDARTGTLGIQTNTFNFWGIQIESGSVATAFQTATGTVQGELAACQRYLPSIATGSYLIGGSSSTTNSYFDFTFQVPARITPTGITISALGNYAVLNATTASGTPTAIAFGAGSAATALLQVTTTAGTPTIVSGQTAYLFLTSSNILFTGAEL